MILETLLTEKPPVICITTLGLIFSTGRRSSTQGTNFHTCVFYRTECHNRYICTFWQLHPSNW